jgi:hypothetical protein
MTAPAAGSEEVARGGEEVATADGEMATAGGFEGIVFFAYIRPPKT